MSASENSARCPGGTARAGALFGLLGSPAVYAYSCTVKGRAVVLIATKTDCPRSSRRPIANAHRLAFVVEPPAVATPVIGAGVADAPKASTTTGAPFRTRMSTLYPEPAGTRSMRLMRVTLRGGTSMAFGSSELEPSRTTPTSTLADTCSKFAMETASAEPALASPNGRRHRDAAPVIPSDTARPLRASVPSKIKERSATTRPVRACTAIATFSSRRT
jgi:hypothetical protein